MTLPVDHLTTAESDDDQRKLQARIKQAVVMMVDDEVGVLDMLEASLRKRGYRQFIKLDQPIQTLEYIKQEQPDVLLLDLEMPGVDSFDILMAIRANDDTRALPVIMLSSNSNPASNSRAWKFGVTELLTKPIDATELALRLRNSLTIKAYQDQLAYYDTLTRLPNRKLFIERVERAINNARQQQQAICVLSIAIDRFQQINDSFGLKTGDTLLQRIATRLMNTLRSDDSVFSLYGAGLISQIARSGGDEFSILLTDQDEMKGVRQLADKLLDNVRRPFDIEGNEIFVTASIGIASFPKNGDKADVLLRHADAACAYSKRLGRDGYSVYSPAINVMSRKMMDLETALRRALSKDEMRLHYQPKIHASTGKLVGVEALLRWYREDGTLVSPQQFIPIAETTGLIVPIGEWVISEACRQNSVWQQAGLEALKVSVNVSGHQFRKRGFASIIESALSQSGMAADKLMIELTESMLTGDVDRHVRILADIKAMGAGLSIDDFGTGYSSLSYLSRFPIDELKIDRSFITNVPDSTQEAAIVKAIIVMAKSLNLDVVAEGVESNEQLEFLQALDCDIIQGYFYNRALPADELFEFAKEWCPRDDSNVRPSA